MTRKHARLYMHKFGSVHMPSRERLTSSLSCRPLVCLFYFNVTFNEAIAQLLSTCLLALFNVT